MTICDLKQKEVINIKDCKRLGFVGDVDFDMKTGCMTALIVPGPGCICGFLGILKIHILKIDGNNLVLFDAILQQPILVHFHQNRLSAAADTCYDLDELLVLKRNQFIQVFSSGNSHNKPSAAFNDSIRPKV